MFFYPQTYCTVNLSPTYQENTPVLRTQTAKQKIAYLVDSQLLFYSNKMFDFIILNLPSSIYH